MLLMIYGFPRFRKVLFTIQNTYYMAVIFQNVIAPVLHFYITVNFCDVLYYSTRKTRWTFIFPDLSLNNIKL